MKFIYNLFVVIISKLKGEKKDFFLDYKYDAIKEYHGSRCLDVGAGTGRFANYLHQNGHHVQLIDIVDMCEFPDLDFASFNGKEIGFEDNSFDTILLMFVLHHTDYQDQLIEECRRVTSRYIIIAEDVIQNKFDLLMGNIHLGTSPWSRSKNGFRTDQEWNEFFASKNLTVVDEVTIARNIYPVYPVFRKIYVLDKDGGSTK